MGIINTIGGIFKKPKETVTVTPVDTGAVGYIITTTPGQTNVTPVNIVKYRSGGGGSSGGGSSSATQQATAQLSEAQARQLALIQQEQQIAEQAKQKQIQQQQLLRQAVTREQQQQALQRADIQSTYTNNLAQATRNASQMNQQQYEKIISESKYSNNPPSQQQYTFKKYASAVGSSIKSDVKKLANINNPQLYPRETINTFIGYGSNLLAEKTGTQKYNIKVPFSSPADIISTSLFTPFMLSTQAVGESIGAISPLTKTQFFSEYKSIPNAEGKELFKVSTIAKTTTGIGVKQRTTFGGSIAYTGLGEEANLLAGKGFTRTTVAKAYPRIIETTQELFTGKVDDIGSSLFKKTGSPNVGLEAGQGIKLTSNTNVLSTTTENPYLSRTKFKPFNSEVDTIFGSVKEFTLKNEPTGSYIFRGGTETARRINYNVATNEFSNILKVNINTQGFIVPAKEVSQTINFVADKFTGLSGNIPVQSLKQTLSSQSLKQITKASTPIVSRTQSQAIGIFTSRANTLSAISSLVKSTILPSIYFGTGQYEKSNGFVTGLTILNKPSNVINQVSSIPKTNVETKITTIQLQTPSLASINKVGEISRGRTQEINKEIYKQVPIQQPVTRYKQQEKFNLNLMQRQQQVQKYKNQIPFISFPNIPKEKMFGYINPKVRPNLKLSTPSYSVSVRRFGKWNIFGKSSSPLGAFKIGESYTRRSLGASFKLNNVEKIPYAPQGYYVKKEKGQQIFIQKRKGRLSSLGEIEEIQSYAKTKSRRKNK